MEHNFLWYAISIFINDVLYRDQIFLNSFNVTDVESIIEDNTFKFKLKVNGIPCRFVYTFSSNVAIEGELMISNINAGMSITYSVIRCNDSVRIGHSEKEYHEIYCYLGKRYIDVVVNGGRKTEVTNITIDHSDEKFYKASVVSTNVADNRVEKVDRSIDRLLFAVSGAIDYEITRCHDVICFSCAKIKMVVYDSGSLQVICVDSSIGPDRKLGEIHPINSNFRQFFEYDVDNDTCEITEYIETVDNPKAIRREYRYHQDLDSRIIDIDGQKFYVVHKGNDITFVHA